MPLAQASKACTDYREVLAGYKIGDTRNQPPCVINLYKHQEWQNMDFEKIKKFWIHILDGNLFLKMLLYMGCISYAHFSAL